MRKKIPVAIIIFANLSSMIIFVIYNDFFNPFYLGYGRTPLFIRIITLPFFVFWIITITSLIRLKNWARIAYIIIHIILALITLFICFGTFLTYALAGGPKENSIILVYVSILTPLAISYFLIAIIYFLRSNTVKLFKE